MEEKDKQVELSNETKKYFFSSILLDGLCTADEEIALEEKHANILYA